MHTDIREAIELRDGDAKRYGAEVFHTLKKLLQKRGLVTSVGDEGGFAPNLKRNTEAVDVIVEAIKAAGCKPGKDIAITLDPAASEFYDNGSYVMKKSDRSRKTSTEMVRLWGNWANPFAGRRHGRCSRPKENEPRASHYETVIAPSWMVHFLGVQ